MITSYDDMRLMIQEWYAQAMDYEMLAELQLLPQLRSKNGW